jgi:hypothetical protein
MTSVQDFSESDWGISSSPPRIENEWWAVEIWYRAEQDKGGES